MIGNGWAQEVCARVQDLTAMQAAAVQQELMVAAYSCNEVALYNAFVNAYQKDLQTSDIALQSFFVRLNRETGERDYHSYKTRLANVSSRRSAGDLRAYCARARLAFDAALNAENKSLSAFVLAQPVPAEQGYAACGVSVAGGAMTTSSPAPATANPPITARAAEPRHAPSAGPPPAAPARAAVPPVMASPPAATTPTPPPAAALAREDGRNALTSRAPAYAANDEPQATQSPRYAPPRARSDTALAYRYSARERDRRAYDEGGYWNRYGEWVPYANPYGRYDRYYRGVPRQFYPWRR